MSARSPPQRQDSVASTTSSGGRTVTGRTPRRRSSASNHQAHASGLFARLTGKHTSSPSPSSSSTASPTPINSASDEETGNEGENGREGDDVEERGIEAGPSDYWRRTPSPPASPPQSWRTKSTEMWADDIEDGPSDVWKSHDSPVGGRFTPPFKPSSPAPVTPSTSAGIVRPKNSSGVRQEKGFGDGDYFNHQHRDSSPAAQEMADVEAEVESQQDMKEYERRMKDVFTDTNTPGSGLSPAASTESPGLAYKGKERGGYDAEYKAIVGERTSRGEEEFGRLEFPQRDDASDATPSSMSGPTRPLVTPSPLKRNVTPYLHPSVSRLRSHLRTASSTSQNSVNSFARPPQDRMPSHFSQISLSRSESTSTLSVMPGSPGPSLTAPKEASPAFVFHPLRQLSANLFSRKGSGRSSPARPPPNRRTSIMVEDVVLGRPSVMDVRGMIAVGTDGGYTVVYDFSQEIKHILGSEATVKASGAVTAVTISPDQTYIAVGHATGNIYLYDFASPAKPARTTLALTLKQVLSGRKEGHLQGSRILHIGFVGSRHTSIVTGDEHGRAFWWSLGKVIGVESNDVVRMLGSYPEQEPSPVNGKLSYPSKRPSTLFAVHSLPLGEKGHLTDTFNFTTLLTPIKLVIVGMKPTAKTWFRKMRDNLGGSAGGFVGCATWLKAGELDEGRDPVLAYSWGSHVRFLRVKVVTETAEDGSGKKTEVPEFVEGQKFEASTSVLALQWYDPNHLLIVTSSETVLLDVRTGQAVENTPLNTRLLMSNGFYAGLTGKQPSFTVPDAVNSSVRTHRGKLFLLTQSNVQVGTLQHWNDRILARVHAGDFLAAIQVALSYYESRATGNFIGLPDGVAERKSVVGRRIRELMRASLEWAFSEDRMRDDTHYSSDGRGVDLTSLFEGLAGCCIEACLAMDDMSFLFDDAYDSYSNVGIQGIFLGLLENYIFDGRIKDVPPNVVQALISMHDDKGELDSAEAIIWHVDPISLDINQAVTLCEKHGLWDALIHVYTRSMRDYTAPLVKLVGVVDEIQKQRQDRPDLVEGDAMMDEHLAPEAYKLFAYIEHILSGISYPSGETIPADQADYARAEVYGFLFSDRLLFWPEGSDGQLVLPSQEDVPYPYLDLLLRFDTEAFLHSTDIAFEDTYMNDSRASFSRQTIINIMLDLVTPPRFHLGDVTLLHIFVARNLPKYPQFLFIPPSTLHRILISLAEDTDQSTREDRQLAAEYLLSAYTPHDSDDMLGLFERAGFWRILREWYTREKKWRLLIKAYIDDPEVDSEVFSRLEGIVKSTATKSGMAPDVLRGIEEAIPVLLDLSVRQTALLLDTSMPSLHDTALQALVGTEHKKMAYLRCLLQPSDDDLSVNRKVSTNLDSAARHAYVQLLTTHDSSNVIAFLDDVDPDFFDLPKLASEFEVKRVFEGQLWALDRQGKTSEAFDIAREVVHAQATDLATGLVQHDQGGVHMSLHALDGTTKMAVRLCREHSAKKTDGVEDFWFGVLHELLEVNHNLSTISLPSSGPEGDQVQNEHREVEDHVRALVTDTLSALVASSSAHLSFPRLFKRLVDTAPETREGKTRPKKKGRVYSEFRSILTGMLESYRSETEMLVMTTRLMQDDLFGNVRLMTEKRQAGWRPSQGICEGCGKALFRRNEGSKGVKLDGDDGEAVETGVIVLGSGKGIHVGCRDIVQQ